MSTIIMNHTQSHPPMHAVEEEEEVGESSVSSSSVTTLTTTASLPYHIDLNGSHSLHSKWTLYYHDPENNSWTTDSYIKITEISTIEYFWTIYNALPKQTFHLGMFFLMRNDILPVWEHPMNQHGGYWSYKIPILNVYEVWVDLSIYVTSEQLTNIATINGISVSPKKGFCVIKIWNHDKTQQNITCLNNVSFLNHTEAYYTPFSSK